MLGHAQDITERRDYEQKLRELSTIDPLTGCHNRRYLDEHTLRLGASPWGCIVVDLDKFKLINDTYGHERGDQVLVGMAAFLRRHAPESAIVVRLGGDEFLLMIDATHADGLARLASELRADPLQAPAEFTIGCAVRASGESLEETLRRADSALYASRAAARGDGARRITDA